MTDADDATPDELWEELPGTTGRERGDILLRLCYQLESSHDHATAMACAQEAVEVYDSVGAQREKAMALVSVGYGHSNADDFDQAIAAYQEARNLFEHHGEPRDLLPLYEGLGHAYRLQQRWDESLAAFTTLDELVRDVDWSPRNVAASAHRLGLTYVARGGCDDKAIRYYTEAIEYGAGAMNTHWVCDVRNALGFAFQRQSRPVAALEALQQNVAVAKACECTDCYVEALTALANIEAEIGDRISADQHYRDAIRRAKAKSGGEPVEANAEHLLFLAEGAETLAEAITWVEQARAIYETLGSTYGRLACLYTLAEACVQAEEYEQALRHYSDVAPLVAEHDPCRGEYELARKLATVHVLMGNARSALPLIVANGWVAGEGPITSRDRALHLAGYCEALVAADQRQTALRQCERLITAIAGQNWPDIDGRAHWVRAQALQHQDPIGSERAAQRAMAYLLTSGDYELATTIGRQYFIEPYETLAKIDIDNQMRAEAEAAERTMLAEAQARTAMEIVAATAIPDPIEEQVPRPTSETGAA